MLLWLDPLCGDRRAIARHALSLLNLPENFGGTGCDMGDVSRLSFQMDERNAKRVEIDG
jgi:hypothetical protein